MKAGAARKALRIVAARKGIEPLVSGVREMLRRSSASEAVLENTIKTI